MRINLGDEVKDMVTGFKGIAVARHEFLNGCARIGVQPKIKKDGALPDEYTFDEPQLVLIKAKVIPDGKHVTGGPERSMPKAKSDGRR